jgi:uncharacterized membrane protein YhaH (DUF805 family)
MTFQDSIRTVLSKYATFTGRAGRPEYWWWVLAVLIAAAVASVLDGMIFGSDVSIFGGLLSLAIVVPNIAVGVRRLHDTDRSGWWLTLTLIPVIGLLVLIWFMIQPGTPGANRFG